MQTIKTLPLVVVLVFLSAATLAVAQNNQGPIQYSNGNVEKLAVNVSEISDGKRDVDFGQPPRQLNFAVNADVVPDDGRRPNGYPQSSNNQKPTNRPRDTKDGTSAPSSANLVVPTKNSAMSATFSIFLLIAACSSTITLINSSYYTTVFPLE